MQNRYPFNQWQEIIGNCDTQLFLGCTDEDAFRSCPLVKKEGDAHVGISISGSSQKRKLMNIGYYHGYKGYRYINTPSNHVPYTKFEELVAVYEFDAGLKSLFYPNVMLIETAVKNYVLDILDVSAGI